MAGEKTRRTGTPLQDLLRNARRPAETVEDERQPIVAPAESNAPPSAIPDSPDTGRSLTMVEALQPEQNAPAVPEYDPAPPVPSATPASAAAPTGPGAGVTSDVAMLARRGQKARPTILIEPADLQTLRDWQAAAAVEWEAKVLDDSKIVRALIQAAREAGVPVGTAGGEAHLRRLLLGVMRRGLVAGGT